MTGTSCRLTINPMVPGDKADPNNFKIMEEMLVRSIVINPANACGALHDFPFRSRR